MGSKTLKSQKPAPKRTHAYAGRGEYRVTPGGIAGMRSVAEHRVPKSKNPPPLRPELAALAVEHLGEAFAVLEARGSDRLDFHDASVVGVRDLIEAAYERGRQAPERFEAIRALLELLDLIEEGVTEDGVFTVAPAREALKLVKAVRA